LMMRVREDIRIERLAKLNQVKINLSPLNGSAAPATKKIKQDKVISHKFVKDPNAVRATLQMALTAVLGRAPSTAELDVAMKQAGY
jgi:hypothetical protein